MKDHTHQGYRPDIDGLRAIAILSVVAYHVGVPWISGGFVGVDVFFVISGYLITQILLKNLDRPLGISLSEFYVRRAKRILPCLAVVMLMTAVASAFLLPPFGERQLLAWSGLSALLFGANVFFYRNTAGYFDGPSDSHPLLHLWSLSVEEQFYVVWPVLLIGIGWRWNRGNTSQPVRLAIGGISLASFIANILWIGSDQKAVFYLLPFRAWEIGAGALLATVPWQAKWLASRMANLTGLTGLAAIVVACTSLRGEDAFPGWAALLPVFGAALIIICGALDSQSFVCRLLGWRWLVRIGLVSYGWYLWHWPMLTLARESRNWRQDLPADVVMALLALVAAIASYRWVENPVRAGAVVANWTPRHILGTAAAAIAMMLFLYAGFGAWAKFGPKSPLLVESQSETPPTKYTCLAYHAEWAGDLSRPSCLEESGIHDGQARPLLVIWGDSQANAWVPGFRDRVSPAMAEVREMTMAACPPLLDVTPSTGPGAGMAGCRRFNRDVVSYLLAARRAQPERTISVVMTARWAGYVEDPLFPFRRGLPWRTDYRAESKPERLGALELGVRSSLAALDRLAIRVLLIVGQPEYRIAPIRCRKGSLNSEECDVGRDEVDHYRAASSSILQNIVGGHKNTRYLDAIDFFCDALRCMAFVDGRLSGYDDCHVSISAAKAFLRSRDSYVAWLLGS